MRLRHAGNRLDGNGPGERQHYDAVMAMGVSHLHAILLSQPDGSWAVKDAGSENGTMINGREIPAGQLVPLRSGDAICIGAWTAITIVAASA